VREHEDPGGDETEQQRRDRERRRRRREERQDTADAVGDTCELIDSVRACGSGCGRLGRGRSGGDGDGCSCDGPCDLSLLRISPLLLVAAAVVPARAGGLVRAALRGYQRWLSSFTPACPSTPSCSAYALAAVARHGARRGLRLAAARVRACGTTPGTATRRTGGPGLPTPGG
jgi:putative component of membrane protein insertase Oxa1/YidC/SpoIIIJ protein YidD